MNKDGVPKLTLRFEPNRHQDIERQNTMNDVWVPKPSQNRVYNP